MECLQSDGEADMSKSSFINTLWVFTFYNIQPQNAILHGKEGFAGYTNWCVWQKNYRYFIQSFAHLQVVFAFEYHPTYEQRLQFGIIKFSFHVVQIKKKTFLEPLKLLYVF